jgi:uncharacterized protein
MAVEGAYPNVWVDDEDGHVTTPLQLALRAGDVAKIEELRAAGADVNFPDMSGATPIMTAAGKGRKAIVTLLLAAGANVNHTSNAHGYAALHVASFCGHVEAARVLVDAGARVDVLDKYECLPVDRVRGWGALWFAWPRRPAQHPLVWWRVWHATRSLIA